MPKSALIGELQKKQKNFFYTFIALEILHIIFF
jgi:hypothetical protein